jgi:hypothetical protein
VTKVEHPENIDSWSLPNVRAYAKLHGITCQKTVIFKLTPARILKLKRPVAILTRSRAYLNISLFFYQTNVDSVSCHDKYECDMMTF